MERITYLSQLRVWKAAVEVSMKIFDLSTAFPREERYSLTDQIRRSSRSVAANIAEAWRKRRYKAAFVSKLNDSESEAAETQTWIVFAIRCGYMSRENGKQLLVEYNNILGQLVSMISKPDDWVINESEEEYRPEDPVPDENDPWHI